MGTLPALVFYPYGFLVILNSLCLTLDSSQLFLLVFGRRFKNISFGAIKSRLKAKFELLYYGILKTRFRSDNKMKIVIFVVLMLFAVSSAISLCRKVVYKKNLRDDEDECTYGPSYYCENLIYASTCSTMKRCIQTVWIRKKYPPDSSSVCDKCKAMVKQAKNQWLCNESQEEIKEVFQDFCTQLHIKPIVQECDKIANYCIPQFVEILVSKMNPQTVCAVSGLCNSARITQLLAEAEQDLSKLFPDDSLGKNKCRTTVEEFNNNGQEGFLKSMLWLCGNFNSFSDACSNLVVIHIQDFYNYIKQIMNTDDFCLSTAPFFENICKQNIQITSTSKIEHVQIENENDVYSCQLLLQMMNHLRDILIANKTEDEFKTVLERRCKQTESTFISECLIIVNRYYKDIYNDLVNGLNGNATCKLKLDYPMSSAVTYLP
ncbi:hypothetical protein ABEB36_005352 [Hypothenemus hampei]|uniref:Uncharacterized protein n=1 Tax=Hypothenemus hampei TaxID=57062 RepID=A0ABD1EXZ3_HYPHA